MLKKCLERGDDFVASNGYNMWRLCFVKMIRQRFDVQYRDHGFYHLMRLAIEVGDGGALFQDLRSIFNAPLTRQNLARVRHYAMEFARKHFQEDYLRQQRLIYATSRHIQVSGVTPELVSRGLSG